MLCDTAPMRTLAPLVAGILIGIIVTVGYVQMVGGWYVYNTLDEIECRATPMNAEVTPNQPNPCNFRRPRWRLLY